MSARIPRPAAEEHAPYYAKYIEAIPEGDAWPVLSRRAADTISAVEPLSDSQALHRYAPGKWSIKQTLGHVIDVERVMALRALWFAREDSSPLPGFDENLWVPAADFDLRPLAKLIAELRAVREATLTLAESFDQEQLIRVGTANGNPFSVRALLWVIAGHEQHHAKLLRERYGLAGAAR